MSSPSQAFLDSFFMFVCVSEAVWSPIEPSSQVWVHSLDSMYHRNASL